jgi:hypothetical protein
MTKSVLQDWVNELPLRQQGVLVLALRGPDGARKEDVAKPLVRTLRALVMNSGREGKPMSLGVRWTDDPFMTTWHVADSQRWNPVVDEFYGSIDQYNVHFLQHLWHAYAIVGINHPIPVIQARAWQVYVRGVHALHMFPETREQIEHRLRDGVRHEDMELARP